MRKSVFLIALLAALSLACNFSFSTANVEEAKLAKDEAGTEQTTVFDQGDEFYLVGQLANAPDDTKLRAVWTAIDADGVEPDYQLDAKEVTGGGNFYFSLSNDQLWPKGTYKVDLYLNDELDRTLEFAVEGTVVAEASSPTPEPEPTPTEATPESTDPADDVSTLAGATDDQTDSDSLLVEATEEAEETVVEPLPFQEELYQHSSGAFTFAVPEGWKLVEETDSSVSFGDEDSVVGAVFIDAGGILSVAEFNDFVEGFLEGYLGEDTAYEIIEQEPQPDDSLYVAISYDDQGRPSDADFFFEQRETVMFVLLLDTFTYTEIRPTWDEIIASYAVDAQAALAAEPAENADSVLTPDNRPAVAPTEAAAPKPVDPYAPNPGQSRLYVFNEFREELTFTINNQEVKIPTTATPDNPVPIDLPPGKYTYTVSIPGGAANGEVEVGPNQSWSIGVRGDGAVYNPFQLYP